MTQLALLVLATVAYTDQFDYPLSLRQIHQRLVSTTALKSLGITTVAARPALRAVTATQITQTVNSLVKQGLLIKQGAWYGFASDHGQFITRRERAAVAQAREADWQELRAVVAKIPWILGVAITGSAAMANASAQADLDILVLTTPGRLWLTRLVVLIISAWRRHHHKSGWCFNLWLEPAALSLESTRQGVYEAYELWQCRWLFDRHQWQKAWLHQNLWFRQFLPLVSVPAVPKIRTELPQPASAHHFTVKLGDHLNYLAYIVQVYYRLWRYQEDLPPLDRAFLHRPEARAQIYRRWQASLTKVIKLNKRLLGNNSK